VYALLADERVSSASECGLSLVHALVRGHTEVVQALLAGCHAISRDHMGHALREATARGLTPVVRALLADGRADPEVARHCMRTPATRRAMARALRWRRRRLWLRAGAHPRVSAAWSPCTFPSPVTCAPADGP
jgi:hypothetical protein